MPLILNGTTGISGVDGSAGTPSYVGADTDTGVLFPAANTLALSTSGAERVRVDSSGNVGIGVTPSGTSKLDVNGQIYSSNGTASAPGFTSRGQNNAGLFFTDDGVASIVGISAGGVERMRIIGQNGNVGIGTSSPNVKLDVNGISGWAGSTTGIASSVTGANASIGNGGNLRVLTSTTQGADVGGSITLGGYYIGTSNSVDFAEIAGRKENATSGNSAGYLQFGTRANAGNITERMRIDSSGRLLVGTTSATFTYTGAGQTATAQQVISTSGYDCINLISTGANPGIDFSQPNSASTIYRFANITGVMTTSTAGSESGALIFATGSAGANSAERMRIDASGRVTMPSQPTFFARGSANLSPASGTSKVTGLSTADINIGSSYNTSTSTFTTPVAGTYQITLIATWNTSGSSQYIGAVLYKNGGNAFSTYSSKPSSGYAQTVLTVNITLSAGDTLEFYIDTQAGGCELERGRTYFMGRLLG